MFHLQAAGIHLVFTSFGSCNVFHPMENQTTSESLDGSTAQENRRATKNQPPSPLEPPHHKIRLCHRITTIPSTKTQHSSNKNVSQSIQSPPKKKKKNYHKASLHEDFPAANLSNIASIVEAIEVTKMHAFQYHMTSSYYRCRARGSW